MTKRFDRRKFLLYSSATLTSSLFLKACRTPTPTATPAASGTSTGTTPAAGGGNTLKVGILHSLSGTMSISEKSVVEAEQLAI